MLDGIAVALAAPGVAEPVVALLLLVEVLLPVAVGVVVAVVGVPVADDCVVGAWVGAGAEDVDVCGVGDAAATGSA